MCTEEQRQTVWRELHSRSSNTYRYCIDKVNSDHMKVKRTYTVPKVLQDISKNPIHTNIQLVIRFQQTRQVISSTCTDTVLFMQC